jgi:hypothetical protein
MLGAHGLFEANLAPKFQKSNYETNNIKVPFPRSHPNAKKPDLGQKQAKKSHFRPKNGVF